MGTLRLRPGTVAWRAWRLMLVNTAEAMRTNVGVELAPRRVCAARDTPGTLTCVTDASGNDGVGGYAFFTDRPAEVWIASEHWPASVLAALDQAAARAHERTSSRLLPMPAAELYGAWAIAGAAMADINASRGRVTRVVAVGDCAPAAQVLHEARSGNEIMRATLRGARQLTGEWVAVAIPRTLNLDADRLSHPEHLPEVAAEAERAGLRVHIVRIRSESWTTLEAAIQTAAAAAAATPGGVVRTTHATMHET